MMAGDDFFRTRMGQRFYEATMPKIADQLERLNTNIEALVAELRKMPDPPLDRGPVTAPNRDQAPAPDGE